MLNAFEEDLGERGCRESLGRSVFYELMKLSSDRSHPLELLLEPSAFIDCPLDFHLRLVATSKFCERVWGLREANSFLIFNGRMLLMLKRQYFVLHLNSSLILKILAADLIFRWPSALIMISVGSVVFFNSNLQVDKILVESLIYRSGSSYLFLWSSKFVSILLSHLRCSSHLRASYFKQYFMVR